jgi:hypothetical protein
MKNAFRAIALAFVFVALLTACGTGATSTPVALETATNIPVALPTAAPSDPCANTYYHVQPNTRWAYSSTGSPSGPYEFVEKINEVRPDGFILSSQFRKVPSSIEWACRPEGLVPLAMIVDNATSILAFQKLIDVKVTNITGSIIPPTMTPGMQWNYAIDVEAAQKAQGGVTSPVTGHISTTYTAGNMESITVPAGTYDTIAVNVKMTIDFVVKGPNGDSKINLNSDYTYWYAAGVGWVKASGNGNLGGQEYFETLVLTSFSTQ